MRADVDEFRELAPPLRHHAGALLRKPRNEQEMTEPPRRVVGKRQVRPNLSRTDFGYTERPRVPVQKAAKKVKRDEEEEGGATGASDRPARADKDSRSLVREHTPDQSGRPTRALALSLPSLARSSPCSSQRLRLPLCLSRGFDLVCPPLWCRRWISRSLTWPHSSDTSVTTA